MISDHTMYSIVIVSPVYCENQLSNCNNLIYVCASCSFFVCVVCISLVHLSMSSTNDIGEINNNVLFGGNTEEILKPDLLT